MLKRKIDEDLVRWKAMPQRPALMIKGPRGCGKSTSVAAFAKANYQNIATLTFDKYPHYRQFFHDSFNSKMLDVFLEKLVKRFRIVKGKTLIIFDELSDCPQIRAALENLHADGRFDIIATASATDMKRTRHAAAADTPHVAVLRMGPLDFEEWLDAQRAKVGPLYQPGELDGVRDTLLSGRSLDEKLDVKLRDSFMRYAQTGGFPEIVADYVAKKAIDNSIFLGKRVLEALRDDLTANLSVKAEAANLILDSLPPQMAKTNRRFEQRLFGPFASTDDCRETLAWLESVGLVHIARETTMPLDREPDGEDVKVYCVDPGLFFVLSGEDYEKPFFNYRWAEIPAGYMETIAVAMLARRGRTVTFARSEAGKAQVPFTIHDPVEGPMLVDVKPDGGRRTLLEKALEAQPDVKARAVLLCDGPASVKNGILKLPLYAAGFI